MKSESHCRNRPNLVWIGKFTLEANSNQAQVQNQAFGNDDEASDIVFLFNFKSVNIK